MSFLNRAFLYVTRKKGKSALLFAVLFIIATFALTGISIGNATEQAESNLRESLGGKFTVWPSMDLKNPYVIIDQGIKEEQAWMSAYNTESVYPAMIDSIMKVAGIKYYNAQAEWSPDAENYKFCKKPMMLPLDEEFKKMANCVGVSDTEHNEHFTSGVIRLTEGRNIKLTDSYTAVISTDLAQKNGFKIGDKLQFRTARLDNKAPATNGRLIELTIVGLFELQDVPVPLEPQTSYEMMENRIFTDMKSATYAYYGDTGKYLYNQATFVIDDPSKLDEIMGKVKAVNINWVPYEFNTYSEEYQQAAAPLERLGSLIKKLLIIIVIVSACILSLILTMWIRNRVHETGVLLSMGISKVKIIGQFLVEVMLIAVFAFGLSYFSGNAIAQNAGNMLTKQSTVMQENNKPPVEINMGEGQLAITQSDSSDEDADETVWDILAPVEEISMDVTPQNLLELYGLGTLIILLSVGISSVTVMRLKPREILSKMS